VEKEQSTVAAFAVPSSVAATISHDLHRSRRGYLNPYFSRRALVELEPMLHEKINQLFERLDEHFNKGAPINLDKAFAAMTADIITNRFYGSGFDYLSTPNFDFPVREAFLGVSMLFNFSRFFPRPVQLLRKMPIPVIGMILPSVAAFLRLQNDMERNITATLAANSTTESEKKSVIVQALGDERIPPNERGLARLLDEGTVIIFAGTETSARALSVAMFHLTRNKHLITALRHELSSNLPNVEGDEYTVSQLEPLPYLVCFPQTHPVSIFKPDNRKDRLC
jgi:cytochrome P450